VRVVVGPGDRTGRRAPRARRRGNGGFNSRRTSSGRRVQRPRHRRESTLVRAAAWAQRRRARIWSSRFVVQGADAVGVVVRVAAELGGSTDAAAGAVRELPVAAAARPLVGPSHLCTQLQRPRPTANGSEKDQHSATRCTAEFCFSIVQ
jgi:hypothetical protein